MRKDVVEIALKQIMLDADEREAIEAIVNRYRFDPFGGTYWVASVAYQAGKVAGKREERARRHRAPRVEIVFADDKHKSVSVDLQTKQATLRIPKGQQVALEELELARNMAQASRAGRSPGTLEG